MIFVEKGIDEEYIPQMEKDFANLCNNPSKIEPTVYLNIYEYMVDNKIILYNDGPNIDKEVLTNIFTPYEKGVKGVFGLGLSIVKKTLAFLDYDINIVNEKNGVKFIIS